MQEFRSTKSQGGIARYRTLIVALAVVLVGGVGFAATGAAETLRKKFMVMIDINGEVSEFEVPEGEPMVWTVDDKDGGETTIQVQHIDLADGNHAWVDGLAGDIAIDGKATAVFVGDEAVDGDLSGLLKSGDCGGKMKLIKVTADAEGEGLETLKVMRKIHLADGELEDIDVQKILADAGIDGEGAHAVKMIKIGGGDCAMKALGDGEKKTVMITKDENGEQVIRINGEIVDDADLDPEIAAMLEKMEVREGLVDDDGNHIIRIGASEGGERMIKVSVGTDGVDGDGQIRINVDEEVILDANTEIDSDN